MLLRLFCFTARLPTPSFSLYSRARHRSRCLGREMGQKVLNSVIRRNADFRFCNVSSYTTELLEIHADDPTMHVLFIPGNPGVVSFYKDFVESLYELLEGRASITAVGHISHTKKNWERGRLFSLQEQTDHKMDFIRQEFPNTEIPIVLVGHSIGSYISLDMFHRLQEKVAYCIGLYPFLTMNRQSRIQSLIAIIAASSISCVVISSLVGLLGLLPKRASSLLLRMSIGSSWSVNALETARSHLLKYHTIRNMLFMAMTEFKKLAETPDWAFMNEKCGKLAFLFGTDDHWGPLHLLEEISKQAPEVEVSIEREGHTHAFSCSEEGSLWVAQHVASLIINRISDSSSH